MPAPEADEEVLRELPREPLPPEEDVPPVPEEVLAGVVRLDEELFEALPAVDFFRLLVARSAVDDRLAEDDAAEDCDLDPLSLRTNAEGSSLEEDVRDDLLLRSPAELRPVDPADADGVSDEELLEELFDEERPGEPFDAGPDERPPVALRRLPCWRDCS